MLLKTVITGLIIFPPHSILYCQFVKDKHIIKFVNKCSDNLESILDVIHADNISHSELGSMPNQIPIIRERIKALNTRIEQSNKPQIITGKDLIEMGIKPGPIFKKIKTAIEEETLINPDITMDEALVIVHSFIYSGVKKQEPPFVSDDFQIGPEGAYEHTD